MTRVLWTLVAATVAVAGCGSKSPTTPSNQPTIFTVQMSPANEVPPITNAESTARGTAVITITTNKDSSGAVTGGKVNFSVSCNGFPASTTGLTAAHIHTGAAGVAGGVFVSAGVTGSTAPITNGAGSFTTDADLTADQVNQILANPAGYYFNVHTQLNGGGVMRGQLR